MLLLNLSRIRAPQEHFDEVYTPETFQSNVEDFSVVEPIVLSFDVHKDKDQFRLEGRVRTRLELPCSRCLEPFTRAVDASFDLRYQPHRQNAGEGEKEIEEDDLATAFYEDDAIDLEQLMREQFYLTLPMKPLCQDDCRGLCPICGANLNRAPCGCAHAWDDPRLAPLKALKKES